MRQEKNFSWLLIALLVFLIANPLAEELGLSDRLIRGLLFSWLLAIGVWSLRGFGHYFTTGMVLAVGGILLSILAANTAASDFALSSKLALMGFLLLAVRCTLSQIVLSNEVSVNRLVGAISLYLLLGVLWAAAYAALELISAGSFEGGVVTGPNGWGSDWLYFSFVTMTTLGYGDITPISPLARLLAYLQAVFGMFYIAIFVAGLVGAYVSDRTSS